MNTTINTQTHFTMKTDTHDFQMLTVQDIIHVLSIIIQMGHDVSDALKHYWLTLQQFYMPFYSSTIKHKEFFHILRFLHFSDNMNQPDKNNNNYDKLCKIKTP